jgi:hypothetical protein
MKKVSIAVVLFFVGLAIGFIVAHGTLNAQGTDNEADIMSRLNDIAKGQQELMAAVNSIKEDLQIIKIRITQNQ